MILVSYPSETENSDRGPAPRVFLQPYHPPYLSLAMLPIGLRQMRESFARAFWWRGFGSFLGWPRASPFPLVAPLKIDLKFRGLCSIGGVIGGSPGVQKGYKTKIRCGVRGKNIDQGGGSPKPGFWVLGRSGVEKWPNGEVGQALMLTKTPHSGYPWVIPDNIKRKRDQSLLINPFKLLVIMVGRRGLEPQT